MKKGKTLMEVFAEEDAKVSRQDLDALGDVMDPEYEKKEQKPQKGRFNVAGQVINHPKLKGEWLIVATQKAGGSSGEGMSGHDDYPDGHEIVLRKLMWGSSENIDWSVPEKRFYQSGCFIPEVMLTNPKVVRNMAKKG